MEKCPNAPNLYTTSFYLRDSPCYENMSNYDNDKKQENLQQYRGRFYLTVEKILAFASSTNLVRKVNNMSFNFYDVVQ